jgi:hypothetical protein
VSCLSLSRSLAAGLDWRQPVVLQQLAHLHHLAAAPQQPRTETGRSRCAASAANRNRSGTPKCGHAAQGAAASPPSTQASVHAASSRQQQTAAQRSRGSAMQWLASELAHHDAVIQQLGRPRRCEAVGSERQQQQHAQSSHPAAAHAHAAPSAQRHTRRQQWQQASSSAPQPYPVYLTTPLGLPHAPVVTRKHCERNCRAFKLRGVTVS